MPAAKRPRLRAPDSHTHRLQSLEALLMLDAGDDGVYVPPSYEQLVPQLRSLSANATCRYYAASCARFSLAALLATLAERIALPHAYAFLLAHWRARGWPPRTCSVDELIRAAVDALVLGEAALAAALLTDAGIDGFALRRTPRGTECVPVHSVLVRALGDDLRTPVLEAFLAALLASASSLAAHHEPASAIFFGASNERFVHMAALLACLARGIPLARAFVAHIDCTPTASGIEYLPERRCRVSARHAFSLVHAALAAGDTALARTLLTRYDAGIFDGFAATVSLAHEWHVPATAYDAVLDVMPLNVACSLAVCRSGALLGVGDACTAARACRYIECFAALANNVHANRIVFSTLAHLARVVPLPILVEALARLAAHEAAAALLTGTLQFVCDHARPEPVYVRANAALLVAAARANVVPEARSVYKPSLELVDAVLAMGAPPPVLERLAVCLVRCVEAGCCVRAHTVAATPDESVHTFIECTRAARARSPDADAAERLRASRALLEAGLSYDAFLLAFSNEEAFKDQVEGVGARPLHTLAGALRLWTWAPALAAAHGHVLDASLLHEALLEHEQRRERLAHWGGSGNAFKARHLLASSLALLAHTDTVLAPSAGSVGDNVVHEQSVRSRADWDECAANLHAELQPALAAQRARLFANDA